MAIPATRKGTVGKSEIIRVRGGRIGKEAWRYIARDVIKRIKRGEAKWPVDTGASRARFYQVNIQTNGFDIRNKMKYAKYIEAKHGYIRRFVKVIIPKIVKSLKKKKKPKPDSLLSKALKLKLVDIVSMDVAAAIALAKVRAKARERAKERYG